MFHRKATGELPKFAVRQLEIAAIRYDGYIHQANRTYWKIAHSLFERYLHIFVVRPTKAEGEIAGIYLPPGLINNKKLLGIRASSYTSRS